MKKILSYVLIVICSLFFFSCNRTVINKQANNSSNISVIDISSVTKDRDLNEYTLRVELDTINKILTGNEKVCYINNENVTLDKLYFHLYPNAFSSKDTAPFLFNDFSSAYPQGFSPGYISIKDVSVDNKKVDHLFKNGENTILEIPLTNPLEPGDKVNISMNFDIKIPPAAERFGVLNDIFNLGNWYPIAAVYDDTGWNLDPYYPIGDPFYSDVSNYNVKITVPKQYIPASSGNLISEKVKGSKKTYEFEETSIRDFALSISDKFIVEEKMVDGVMLKCYFLKDKNTLALDTAEKSIKSFNKLFGKYPNKSYSVVETNFPSGMEYPGIVFIGTKFYKEKSLSSYLEAVIVHETAHQWWYGTVGNNEIDEAWLDESMATYSEVIYYYDNYDTVRGKSYYQFNVLDGYEKSQLRADSDKSILRPLSQFQNWDDYGPLVYNKGAMMLHSLRNQVGDELFFRILKNYYSSYSFKNVTTNDFISVVENTTNQEWDEFFNKWLKEKK